jgi:hypothetical protein
MVSGLPDIGKPADQNAFGLRLASPYKLALTGQLTLTFVPDTGGADPAIQFSAGGRTLSFQIPAGGTDAEFAAGSVGLQTGTVAGTIELSARLQSQGANLTATPVRVQSIRIDRASPVIATTSFSRTAAGFEIRVTGYSTAREVTQAVFRFRASPGNSLTTSEITLPVEDSFGRWFREPDSAPYGGQFTFSQQFTVQGDSGAISPLSVTLTNRLGSTTADVR